MFRSLYIGSIAAFLITLGTASPSWAGTSDRVRFEFKPKVVSQIVDRVEGETKLLVASNSAFNISAEGIIGMVSVKIEKKGVISGINFGSAAQLPGSIEHTTFLTSHHSATIYTAARRTARDAGKPIDQAVLILITYSDSTHPSFILEPKAGQS